MESKQDIAVSKFLKGYDCAQAVLYSFCDDLGLEKNSALKIACGFGGGMGSKGEVCGAVTGGIMVIGAKYGRGEEDDRTATNLTFAKTRELMDQFTDKHGSYICRKLLNGCDLMTNEGRRVFNENDLKNEICVSCVKSVVEILENMLNLTG